jgi:mycofactocin glycosyltransferase
VSAALPDGFALALDRSVRTFRGGTTMTGGNPGRLLTLSANGVAALASLVADGPTTPAARRLGARLVEAGMAHPRPLADPNRREGQAGGRSLTVVVPVHNRSAALDRCLGSLGPGVPVVVVDDGSDDPEAVARVCHRHRARLVRRPENGGPAAARNQALEVVDTDLVAFVDSDCRMTDGWIEGLTWLFDDPAIGAVAPRVRPDDSAHSGGSDLSDGAGQSGRPAPRPVPTRSVLARFAAAHSALDMGSEPGEVAPGKAVRYVPTAALVARRLAVGPGFDPHLRVGEDVDLVWRLLDDGWRVRYEPSVTVFHDEPSTWWKTLSRRFRYGTSAGPLSERHPGRLAPVELRPWPAMAAAACLSGRRRAALAVLALSATSLAWQVRDHGIPLSVTTRWSTEGAAWTVLGLGRAATMLAGPAVAVGVLRGKRAVAILVLAPPLVEWWRRRPHLDPVRWSLASIADDVAYGAGVWAGCLRSRSFGPLVPAVRTGWGASSGTP